MFKNIIFPCCLLLVGCSTFAQGFLETYLQENKEIEDTLFVENLPYENYLQQVELQKVIQLEKDKKMLEEYGKDGTVILQNLLKIYLSNINFDTISLVGLQRLILLGEQHLKASQYFSDPDFLYVSFGDELLNKCTEELEKRIQNEEVDKDFQVQYLVKRLEENQFHLDLPISNWEKLQINIKEGNFMYLWKRATGRYLKEFVVGCLVFLGLLGYFFHWMRRKCRK